MPSSTVHRGTLVLSHFVPDISPLLRRNLPDGPRTGRTLGIMARRAILASGKGSKAVHLPSTTPFQERVYAALRKVPRGRVTTYGDLARALKTSPRAIGQALRCNPYAPAVPCHRVVAADGTLGGFKGERDGKPLREKISLLRAEGIIIEEGMIKSFEKKLFSF